MRKLLKEHYKTYEGARKRAGFENGVAASEYHSGYKARLYQYTVVADGAVWRVQRSERFQPGFGLAPGTRYA